MEGDERNSHGRLQGRYDKELKMLRAKGSQNGLGENESSEYVKRA